MREGFEAGGTARAKGRNGSGILQQEHGGSCVYSGMSQVGGGVRGGRVQLRQGIKCKCCSKM